MRYMHELVTVMRHGGVGDNKDSREANKGWPWQEQRIRQSRKTRKGAYEALEVGECSESAELEIK